MSHKLRVAFLDANILENFKEVAGGLVCEKIDASNICESIKNFDICVVDEITACTIHEKCGEGNRPTLVLAMDDESKAPETYFQGLVDDLITMPVRAWDVLRVIHFHKTLLALRELEKDSFAIPELLKKIQDDIHTAQKIQRRLIKDKFPVMGGLSIKSKYWCGLKAGGDYFDVFEFPNSDYIGMILTDASSYSLSTNLLGSLMQFSVHVGRDNLENPAAIVKALHGKLSEVMNEKDKLSIFYGILNRKTYQFRYVDCGNIFAIHRNAHGANTWIAEGKFPELTKVKGEIAQVKEALLEPGDRFVLCSDGWKESFHGTFEKTIASLLGTHKDSQDLLNEMGFALRKNVEKDLDPEEITEEFPMPAQDCSVLIFDVAKNLLRLAK